MSEISWSSIEKISDLYMRRVAAKFVLRLLTSSQKERRLAIQRKEYLDFFSKMMNPPVMDTTPKQSSNQASGSPRPKKTLSSEVKHEDNALYSFDCVSGFRSTGTNC